LQRGAGDFHSDLLQLRSIDVEVITAVVDLLFNL
jgi:hypothetical protein